MYIQPNSTIKLYSGVPLDNTYEHTLYFASLDLQNNYFHNTLSSIVFGNQTYQRINKGVARLNYGAEQLYNINYMAFRNTAYGNKWFYAFVTSVEYVNDVTTNIYFEIDVMQTWFVHDCNMKECFVEREHTLNDVVGNNFEAEPSFAEIIYTDPSAGITYDYPQFPYDTTYVLFAEATYHQTEPLVHNYSVNSQRFLGNIVEGNVATINTEIGNYIANGTSDRIIGVFEVPSAFCDIREGILDTVVPSISTTTLTASQTIDGYTPKNKKCLQFPFQKIVVDNNRGKHIDFAYELFENSEAKFRIYGDCSGLNDEFVCVPILYNGEAFDYTNTLNSNLVKKVSYKQNNIYFSDLTDKITSALTAYVSSGGNPKVALIGGVSSAVDLGAKSMFGYPDTTNVINRDIMTNIGCSAFSLKTLQCKHQIVQKYDEYFTRYGYATNLVKIPNIAGRNIWNYVKTIGAKVIGNCPNDDIKKIEKILDKGITFWKDYNSVGTYSGNN